MGNELVMADEDFDESGAVDEAKAAKEFLQSQKGYRNIVLWLCTKFPSCIGDYRRLVMYAWHYISHTTTVCEHCNRETRIWLTPEQFEKMCRPESVTRAYRKCKERGEINEPEHIVMMKAQKERFFRESHGGSDDIQVIFHD